MTDNEKRVHDLAIASLPLLYNERCKAQSYQAAQEEDSRDPASFDIFEMYCTLYNATLDAFNERFPEK